MKNNSASTQKTVTKLAKDKQAKQTDKESKDLQKLGDKMSAPNDKTAKS
jgi:hypothetical protein